MCAGSAAPGAAVGFPGMGMATAAGAGTIGITGTIGENAPIEKMAHVRVGKADLLFRNML